MLVSLQALHFAALWAAGGIGAGGWILTSVHVRAGARPSPEVARSLMRMGQLALASVVVLWATGAAMLQLQGLPQSPAFTVKLVFAAAILAASLGTNLEVLRAVRAGGPPRAAIMLPLTWTIRAALAVVLIAAAIA